MVLEEVNKTTASKVWQCASKRPEEWGRTAKTMPLTSNASECTSTVYSSEGMILVPACPNQYLMYIQYHAVVLSVGSQRTRKLPARTWKLSGEVPQLIDCACPGLPSLLLHFELWHLRSGLWRTSVTLALTQIHAACNQSWFGRLASANTYSV